MARPTVFLALAAGFQLVCQLPAFSAPVDILVEGFDTEGNGTRYTVNGGGFVAEATYSNIFERWNANSATTDFVSAGQVGTDFFGGQDLDGIPGAFSYANPRSVSLNAVDLSGYEDVQLMFNVASRAGHEPNDFLRFIAVDADTLAETLIDSFNGAGTGAFLSPSGSSPYFVSGAASTNQNFQTYVYDVPLGIDNLVLRFEAFNDGTGEYFGVDQIVLQGEAVPLTPEPSSWLLMIGALAAVFSFSRFRRRRAAIV